MAAQNPKIQNRELSERQPGKRLYFYPKAKTTGTSEEEAMKKRQPTDVQTQEIPKTKTKKKPKKSRTNR